MSHQESCSSGHCSSHSHSHQHSHCGCGCGCGCGCHKKHEHCHSHKEGSYAEQLLRLADEAWEEVLRDKIKEEILKNAQNITALAQLVSETNHKRWKERMAQKTNEDHYEDRLDQILNQE